MFFVLSVSGPLTDPKEFKGMELNFGSLKIEQEAIWSLGVGDMYYLWGIRVCTLDQGTKYR